MCTKMLKKLSEKLRAKFPATTPGCSMLKKMPVSMTLSQKFFNRKQAQQKVNHCSKKKRKEEKGKAKKKCQKSKSLKTQVTFSSQNFDFCACPSHNALKRDAGGKKGKLLCCKRIFERIKGNLAKMQPKNHQNVQKTHFLQNVPGVNGLICLATLNFQRTFFPNKMCFCTSLWAI